LWYAKGTSTDGGTTWSWGSPVLDTATQIAELKLYKLNDNTMGTAGTYSFATGTLSGQEAGWTTDVPSLGTDAGSNGDKVYMVSTVVTGAKDSEVTPNWGTPVVYAYRQDGSPGLDASIYHWNTTNTTVSEQGRTITKTSGGNGNWSGSAYTTESYKDGCKVTFKSGISGEIMVGLTESPSHFTENAENYKFKVNHDHYLGIYIMPDWYDFDIQVDDSMTLEIEYKDNTITFILDGETILDTTLSKSFDFHLATALNVNGCYIEDISFVSLAKQGQDGNRGPGWYSNTTTTNPVTGSWEVGTNLDTDAKNACPDSIPVDGDIVTLTHTYGSATYSQAKKWETSSGWVAPGLYLNGDMIIDGSIAAHKINTTGLIAENISATEIVGKNIIGARITGANINGSVIKASYLDLDGDLEVLTNYHISTATYNSNPSLYTDAVYIDSDDEYRIPTLSSLSVEAVNYRIAPSDYETQLKNASSSAAWIAANAINKTYNVPIYSYDQANVNSNIKLRHLVPYFNIDETILYEGNFTFCYCQGQEMSDDQIVTAYHDMYFYIGNIQVFHLFGGTKGEVIGPVGDIYASGSDGIATVYSPGANMPSIVTLTSYGLSFTVTVDYQTLFYTPTVSTVSVVLNATGTNQKFGANVTGNNIRIIIGPNSFTPIINVTTPHIVVNNLL